MLPAKSKFNPELRRVAQMAKEAGMNADQRRVLLSRQEVPPPNGYKYKLPYTSGDVGFAEVMAEAGANGKLKQTLFESLTFQGIPKIQAEDIRILAQRLRCAREALEHRHHGELQNAYKVPLTESEIQSFNLAVRFFEDWFYRGKWAELSKPRSYARENAWADFFVPATLLNAMAKIKEQSVNAQQAVGFKQDNFLELIRRVSIFGKKILNTHNQEKEIFTDSVDVLSQDFNEANGQSNGLERGLYFIKDILIAGEMARRDFAKATVHDHSYVFTPESLRDVSPGEVSFNRLGRKVREFNFRNGSNQDFVFKMHYVEDYLPFARVAFEYLRQQQNHKNKH